MRIDKYFIRAIVVGSIMAVMRPEIGMLLLFMLVAYLFLANR